MQNFLLFIFYWKKVYTRNFMQDMSMVHSSLFCLAGLNSRSSIVEYGIIVYISNAPTSNTKNQHQFCAICRKKRRKGQVQEISHLAVVYQY